MNLSKYSKYLTNMYNDKLYIKRYIEIENEDGSTDVVLDTDSNLNDIACRVSVIREDEHDSKSIDINKENIKYKIFCDPSVEIQKGDVIDIHIIKNDIVVDKLEGIAGKPIKYDISLEFMLLERDIA